MNIPGRWTSVLVLTLIAGCGGDTHINPPGPLGAGNVNLIFAVSSDVAYNAPGDIDPSTANLTAQGLQRSLLMAAFLRQQVLDNQNVTGIYALEPMTHLQTADNYPDMTALESIQQFALINQITLSTDSSGLNANTGHSYPINASYATGAIPGAVAAGAAAPPPICRACQGLDFNDTGGDNETLAAAIIQANSPGFYVFSAPWETVSGLLTNINAAGHYNLAVPTRYSGPDAVYAISIAPSGNASFVTYDAKLDPPATYPVLPAPPLMTTPCSAQAPFSMSDADPGVDASVPPGTNVNETLFIVRHAEAHPTQFFADGNYVGAGQWRALGLPNALRGKFDVMQVYSIDPSQVTPGTLSASGESNWSNVAPALTVVPYAIANDLPYYLVTNFQIDAANSPGSASDFFFTGGRFSNQSVLLAWQYVQIPQMVGALLLSHGDSQPVPTWPATDYDSIWKVVLDAAGRVTVSNALCEGIDSATLPATAP